MLSSVKALHDYAVEASDGEIGHVANMLFDDVHWTVRYVIINTGNWLFSRHVLISPVSVAALDGQDRTMTVKLKRQQVELSPQVDTNLPMTREKEIELSNHYEYMPYWGGAGSWGVSPVPSAALSPATFAEQALERIERDEEAEAPPTASPHLRSANEVSGYRIVAQGETLGQINDFLLDAETWALRYLVVDTGTLFSGTQLLIARDWIDTVSWADSHMQVDLPRDMVDKAPAFDAGRPVERAYEEQLYAHYGRQPYWEHEAHS